MTPTTKLGGQRDFEASLRTVLVDRFGIQAMQSERQLPGDAIRSELKRSRLDPVDYLDLVRAAPLAAPEIQRLLTLGTIAESYFFRDVEQLELIAGPIVAERRASSPRPVRILCAGCAAGEEPYTIAMLVSALGRAADVELWAADVTASALERATTGRYSAWELRATPAVVKDGMFSIRGAEFELDPRIRAAVRFQLVNLVDPSAPVWSPASWDVVVCRNVLMHLVPEAARNLMSGVARSLVPGGSVFLGHAESSHASAIGLVPHERSGVFSYRQPTSGRRPEAPVNAPSSEPATAAPVTPAAQVGISPLDFGALLALFAGRDAEPLRQALLSASRGQLTPDDRARVALIQAAHGTAFGTPGAAAADCADLVECAVVAPEAHCLLALCREALGDEEAAVAQHRAAVSLDQTFAMAHLRLGVLLRRRGDVTGAREALHRALATLSDETITRITLFGGGFDRQSLMRVCESELRVCGAAA